MKLCNTCEVEKPLSEYYIRKSGDDTHNIGKPVSECKECSRARAKKNVADRSARDPEFHRNKHLKANYGITQVEYEAMAIIQGDRCAICGTDEKPKPHGVWHVDHDHETGKVRGLLCSNCNRALGLIGESVETLQAMIGYLEIHEPEFA